MFPQGSFNFSLHSKIHASITVYVSRLFNMTVMFRLARNLSYLTLICHQCRGRITVYFQPSHQWVAIVNGESPQPSGRCMKVHISGMENRLQVSWFEAGNVVLILPFALSMHLPLPLQYLYVYNIQTDCFTCPNYLQCLTPYSKGFLSSNKLEGSLQAFKPCVGVSLQSC